MMNFKLITKAMLATCLVTGLTVMNSAQGEEFNYSKNSAYSNYSSYQPSTAGYGSSSPYRQADYRTNDNSEYARNNSDYRGSGLDCPNGQCHLRRSNGSCGVTNDNFDNSYDRQRSPSRRNDFTNPPTPPRYDNSDASYRSRDTRYRDSLNRSPSSNDRNSFDRYDASYRGRSDRDRFDERLNSRTRDNQYRPDRLSSRESRDRLTPVSYEARKPPVSNQGRSPFYN